MSKTSRTPRTTNGQAPKPASATAGAATKAGVTSAARTSTPLTSSTKTPSRPITAASAVPPSTTPTASATPAARTGERASGQNTVRPVSKATQQAMSAGQLRRLKAKRDERNRRLMPLYGAGGVLVIVVAIFIIFSLLNTGGSTSANAKTTQAVANSVTTVPLSIYQGIGTGGVTSILQKVTPSVAVLKDSAGKPLIVYVGGEFCPYCAAYRWSIIAALSRFGTFKNLALTTSSSTDIYPDTNTFTFVGSSYTSQYITYSATEIEDRNQQALQTLNAQDQQLFNTYDGPPYSQSAGGIPFLDIANQYVTEASPYNPQDINGMTWSQIAAALGNPGSTPARDIIGTANYLTAAICNVTNNQPASVCQAAPIPTIQQQVNSGK